MSKLEQIFVQNKTQISKINPIKISNYDNIAIYNHFNDFIHLY